MYALLYLPYVDNKAMHWSELHWTKSCQNDFRQRSVNFLKITVFVGKGIYQFTRLRLPYLEWHTCLTPGFESYQQSEWSLLKTILAIADLDWLSEKCSIGGDAFLRSCDAFGSMIFISALHSVLTLLPFVGGKEFQLSHCVQPATQFVTRSEENSEGGVFDLWSNMFSRRTRLSSKLVHKKIIHRNVYWHVQMFQNGSDLRILCRQNNQIFE